MRRSQRGPDAGLGDAPIQLILPTRRLWPKRHWEVADCGAWRPGFLTGILASCSLPGSQSVSGSGSACPGHQSLGPRAVPLFRARWNLPCRSVQHELRLKALSKKFIVFLMLSLFPPLGLKATQLELRGTGSHQLLVSTPCVSPILPLNKQSQEQKQFCFLSFHFATETLA